MSGTTNPLVAQGTLNRVITSVVVSSYPALNVTASYMGKSFSSLSFNDPFVLQPQTGVGIVNSPEPYVGATITVSILKTQALSNAWLSQIAATSILGDITVYGDSTAFPAVTINNASVVGFNPAAFDGTDPTVSVTLAGIYYPNNNMWAG